ncbi:MAG: glycosyl hydrolase-related protein, partial [Eubacteriales bacterium]
EEPMALSFFPTGCEEGKENSIKAFAELSDDVITLAAFKKAERGVGFILRLFNPTGEPRKTTLKMPAIKLSEEFSLGPYEIATYRINPRNKDVTKTSLIEK